MKHPFTVTMALAVALAAAWACAQPKETPPVPGTQGVQNPPAQSSLEGRGPRRQGPHMGRDGNRTKAREMLEQVMIARLSSDLKLTDEQSVQMMRRFTESRTEKQALNKERAEVMRRLHDVVEQQKDEAALNECLTRLRDLDAKLATHRQRLEETMGADLAPWQKGRLVLFLDQFESDIRQMLREAHERRDGQPMDPGGAGRNPMQPGLDGVRPPQELPQGPPPAPAPEPPQAPPSPPESTPAQ